MIRVLDKRGIPHGPGSIRDPQDARRHERTRRAPAPHVGLLGDRRDPERLPRLEYDDGGDGGGDAAGRHPARARRQSLAGAPDLFASRADRRNRRQRDRYRCRCPRWRRARRVPRRPDRPRPAALHARAARGAARARRRAWRRRRRGTASRRGRGRASRRSNCCATTGCAPITASASCSGCSPGLRGTTAMFAMAIRNTWRRRVRSIITMLVVGIGAAAFIGTQALNASVTHDD